MHKLRPLCGIILSLFIITLCATPQARTFFNMPEYKKMVVGESSDININLPENLENKLEMQVMGPSRNVFASPQDPPVTITKNLTGYQIIALKPGKIDLKLKLLGYIPIKSISIESVAPRRVVVGGHSIGVLLQSKGIMVVGFAPVSNSDGEKFYPARQKGVEIGDLIMKVDGNNVSTENDLAKVIDTQNNSKINLTVQRRGKYITIPVEAVYCPETQRYRIGLYVRDGVVGVGTLTFWFPGTKEYAALGHKIIDADTKQGINVLRGKIVSASIQTIKPGKPGKPGEKIGVFNSEGQITGNISKNSYFGIYGKTTGNIINPLNEYIMEVGYAHQVKEGKAQIFTVVNGENIEKFDIVIEKVYPDRENGKGMVIRVSDPGLLSLTGGIIQGMSGSPIIQDSKIIGAVTHVFLNDPQRGYGIFMDNMLSEMSAQRGSLKNVSTN
ncbi:MAG: SpoIVB peptidase [Syntrophomonadaceae bacterium]|nr:SpoIVB peptidase [Syntrophomonadaceae bacterium]MDD3888494.1 SpoIVB peptidase [Syntrophomonadaceae bacterium]MDD4548734.1 SpoIVB peptidase [Syntrophomonadaceae bacterium]